jgi:hypothetical protein
VGGVGLREEIGARQKCPGSTCDEACVGGLHTLVGLRYILGTILVMLVRGIRLAVWPYEWLSREGGARPPAAPVVLS